MIRKAANPIKIGVSSLVFDSPKLERILLIQREKAPFKDMWSFPGGRLDCDEHYREAIIRETYEETGYHIDLLKDQLFNVEHTLTGEYLVITGIGLIINLTPSNDGRTDGDKLIRNKFFQLNDFNEENYLYNLKDEECIPSLKSIVNRYLAIYKDKL